MDLRAQESEWYNGVWAVEDGAFIIERIARCEQHQISVLTSKAWVINDDMI